MFLMVKTFYRCVFSRVLGAKHVFNPTNLQSSIFKCIFLILCFCMLLNVKHVYMYLFAAQLWRVTYYNFQFNKVAIIELYFTCMSRNVNIRLFCVKRWIQRMNSWDGSKSFILCCLGIVVKQLQFCKIWTLH